MQYVFKTRQTLDYPLENCGIATLNAKPDRFINNPSIDNVETTCTANIPRISHNQPRHPPLNLPSDY